MHNLQLESHEYEELTQSFIHFPLNYVLSAYFVQSLMYMLVMPCACRIHCHDGTFYQAVIFNEAKIKLSPELYFFLGKTCFLEFYVIWKLTAPSSIFKDSGVASSNFSLTLISTLSSPVLLCPFWQVGCSIDAFYMWMLWKVHIPDFFQDFLVPGLPIFYCQAPNQPSNCSQLPTGVYSITTQSKMAR